MSGLAWEGGSLRLALAIDSFIYFANIRPDYKWYVCGLSFLSLVQNDTSVLISQSKLLVRAYFGNTLVYAFKKPERTDHCVVVMDTITGDRFRV
jgi:WD repeat-containing protein 35